jgi:hypothetical protein
MGKKVTIASTDITSEKTLHLKAIALLLLMWHHLFGVEYLSGWSAIIPGTEGASYVIGASGRICLAIFLFCSGYGLYKSYISKESTDKTYILKRLAKTLIPYWLVMIIAIGYLIYAGKFEPKYIFVNLFALLHSSDILYVTFSWFIKLYVLLLLVLPLIRLIERKWKKNAIIDLLIYIAVPFTAALLLGRFLHEESYESIPSFIVSTIVFLLAWFPLFAIGMLFAKYNTYKKVRGFADKFPSYLVIILSVLIIGNMFYLRFIVNTFFGDSILYHCCMADVIFEPIFVCAFLLLMDNMRYKSRYVLPFIGKNSVFYWLLSGMFFKNTIELSFLITWPKITILIFIWTMVLLTPFVFALSWISGKLIKLICKK